MNKENKLVPRGDHGPKYRKDLEERGPIEENKGPLRKEPRRDHTDMKERKKRKRKIAPRAICHTYVKKTEEEGPSQ